MYAEELPEAVSRYRREAAYVWQKKEQKCDFDIESYKTYVRVMARQNRTPDVHILPALISSIHKQSGKHIFI